MHPKLQAYWQRTLFVTTPDVLRSYTLMYDAGIMLTKRASGVLNYNPCTFDNYLVQQHFIYIETAY